MANWLRLGTTVGLIERVQEMREWSLTSTGVTVHSEISFAVLSLARARSIVVDVERVTLVGEETWLDRLNICRKLLRLEN